MKLPSLLPVLLFAVCVNCQNIEWIKELEGANDIVRIMPLNNKIFIGANIYKFGTGWWYNGTYTGIFDGTGNLLNSDTTVAWSTSVRALCHDSSTILLAGSNFLKIYDTALDEISKKYIYFEDMDDIGNNHYVVRGFNLAKYDRQFNLIWEKQISTRPEMQIECTQNYIYVKKEFNYSDYVEKYDTLGNLIWSKSIPGTYIGSFKADKDGNCYVSGMFLGSVQFDAYSVHCADCTYDWFIAKLDSTGNWAWARRSYNKSSLCAIPDGSTNYLFSGEATKDTCTYVTVYDKVGNWIKNIPIQKGTWYNVMQITRIGQAIYAGGKTGGQYPQAFLAKITDESLNLPGEETSSPPIKFNSLLLIYPNPTTGKITISGKLRGATIEINDANGKLFYSEQKIQNDKIEIDFSGRARGIYFITLINSEAIETSKIIIE